MILLTFLKNKPFFCLPEVRFFLTFSFLICYPQKYISPKRLLTQSLSGYLYKY